MVEFSINTREHTTFVPVTQMVQDTVEKQGWKNGVLTLYVPHTTAGVTIQENADPDVVSDMIYALEKAVPWKDPAYRHSEGNTAAHVKTAMIGTSGQIIVEKGSLMLGTWQEIYFVEFDGPRQRKMWLQFNENLDS